MFGLLWLARDQLVQHAEWVSGGLRLTFFALIALVVFHNEISSYLPGWTPLAVFALIGVHLGAWFWLFIR